MEVKLKNSWFSPSVSRHLNQVQARSGKYYERGVHAMEDELFRFLPKSAEVLVPPAVMPDLEEGEGPVLEIGEQPSQSGNDLPAYAQSQRAVIASENEVAEKAKESVGKERLAEERAEVDRAARKANFKRKRAAKAKADAAAASRDTK